MLSIGCIIQARLGSTRLPKKVLENIDDKHTMIEFVLKQLEFSKKIDRIVVATTNLKEDDTIVELLKKEKISVFRGDTLDVLDRYYHCAKQFKFDIIVRIGADCPLIEPYVIDDMIGEFCHGGVDYLSNHNPRTYPYGMDVEIFSFFALEKAWKNASLTSEREHVSPYIYNRPEMFNNKNYEYSENYSNIRIVVDREKDIVLIRNLVKIIKDRPIKLKNILDVFRKEPKMFDINQDYQIDEGYVKSVENDERLNKIH